MRGDRWLDHTGLNLIRIVIGSYFMAIALGLIAGVDPSAMFLSLMPPPLPDLLGTMLLFALSVAFMSGLWLRLTALGLALLVLGDSAVQNYMLSEAPVAAAFWRDLALVCAVMLCYSALHRREMRKAALILRRGVRRARLGGDRRIAPRRISSATRGTRRDGASPALRPMIAPPPAGIAEPSPQAGATGAGRDTGRRDDDVDNIFSEI